MLSITIGEGGNARTIDEYLKGYTVHLMEVYDNNAGITSISGKQMNNYLGDKRKLLVNFEAHDTTRLAALINAIKYYRNDIPITYLDPQFGMTAKRFSCPDFPADFWFESDDEQTIFNLPTVTFEETDASAREDWGEYG